ncbi:hypothetical protein U1Q18_008362 [Sarracenia purpurea var. burkii]
MNRFFPGVGSASGSKAHLSKVLFPQLTSFSVRLGEATPSTAKSGSGCGRRLFTLAAGFWSVVFQFSAGVAASFSCVVDGFRRLAASVSYPGFTATNLPFRLMLSSYAL